MIWIILASFATSSLRPQLVYGEGPVNHLLDRPTHHVATQVARRGLESACTASPSSDAVPCSRDGDDGPLHPSSSRLAEATALATPSHRSRRLSGLGCHCESVDVVVDAERGTDANSTSLPTSEQVFSLVGRATVSDL